MSEKTEPLTEEECGELTAFFNEGAAKFTPEDPYWIECDDSGAYYCLKCADKEMVKRKAQWRRLPKKDKIKGDAPYLCGGYSVEHDNTVFCETCSALLDGSLTDYACESEVDHFLGHGFDITSDDDRRAMSEVISTRGWNAWSDRVYQWDYERKREEEYFRDLHTLGRMILASLLRSATPPNEQR